MRRDFMRGADELFRALVRDVPWRAERRPMYERMVDVPRLLCFYEDLADLPHPTLVEAKLVLDAYCGAELGSRSAPPGCATT